MSKMLDTTIANFFNENALPCRFAKLLISVLHQHAGRKYKAPNRRKIGGQLLESAYEHIAAVLPQHSESPADSA
jgi:hypothetical protein